MPLFHLKTIIAYVMTEISVVLINFTEWCLILRPCLYWSLHTNQFRNHVSHWPYSVITNKYESMQFYCSNRSNPGYKSIPCHCLHVKKKLQGTCGRYITGETANYLLYTVDSVKRKRVTTRIQMYRRNKKKLPYQHASFGNMDKKVFFSGNINLFRVMFNFYNTQGVKSKHKSFYSRTFLEDDTVQTKSLCITGFYHRNYLWNLQKQPPSYNRYT